MLFSWVVQTEDFIKLGLVGFNSNYPAVEAIERRVKNSVNFAGNLICVLCPMNCATRDFDNVAGSHLIISIAEMYDRLTV